MSRSRLEFMRSSVVLSRTKRSRSDRFSRRSSRKSCNNILPVLRGSIRAIAAYTNTSEERSIGRHYTAISSLRLSLPRHMDLRLTSTGNPSECLRKFTKVEVST